MTKRALGDLAGILGGGVEQKPTARKGGRASQGKHTGETAQTRQTGQDEIRKVTLYLRPHDEQALIEAVYRLKASRKVRGHAGISFLMRLGLALITEQLRDNPQDLLERAQRMAEESD